jgi:hypothetical protein
MTMLNDIHTQNLPVIKFYAFNPLQPRGKNGMWTHGGEAAAHAGLRQDARKNKLYSIAARHHAQQLGHEAAGAITNGHDVADHLARMGKAVTALRVQAYHSRKKGNMEDAHVRMAAANHYAAMRKGLKMHAKGKGEMPDMEAFGDSHVAAAKASFAQQAKDRAAHGVDAGKLRNQAQTVSDLTVAGKHLATKAHIAGALDAVAKAHEALAAGDKDTALDAAAQARTHLSNAASHIMPGEAKPTKLMPGLMTAHTALNGLHDALSDSPEVANRVQADALHKHAGSLPLHSPERMAADRASALLSGVAMLHRQIRQGGKNSTGIAKSNHQSSQALLAELQKGENNDPETKAALASAAAGLKTTGAKIASRTNSEGRKVLASKIDAHDLASWHNGQEYAASTAPGLDGKPDKISEQLAAAHSALSDAHEARGNGNTPKDTAAQVAEAVKAGEAGSAAQQKHAKLLKASQGIMNMTSKPSAPTAPVQPIDASALKGDTEPVKPDTASSADTGELPKAIVGEKADAAYHTKSSKALSEMADAAPAGSQHRATIKAMADAHKHLALLSAAKIKSSQQVKDGDPDAHKKNAAQLGEHLDNAKNALSNATYTAVPAGPLRDHMESLGADTGGKFGTSLSPEDAKHESQIDGTHTADMWKQSGKTSKAQAQAPADPKGTKPDYETKAGDALLGAHSSKGTLHDAFSHVHNALKSLVSGDAEGAKAHLAKALPLAAKTVANHPLAGLLNDSIKAAQDGVSAGNQPEAGKPMPDPVPGAGQKKNGLTSTGKKSYFETLKDKHGADAARPIFKALQSGDATYKGGQTVAGHLISHYNKGFTDITSEKKGSITSHHLTNPKTGEKIQLNNDTKPFVDLMKSDPKTVADYHQHYGKAIEAPNAPKGADVPSKGVAQSNSGHDLENPQFTEGEHQSVAGEVENSQGKQGSISYTLGTANKHIADAYAKLKSGDKAGAQDSYEKAQAASYGTQHLGVPGSRTAAISDYTKKGLDKVGAAIKGTGQKAPAPTPAGKPASAFNDEEKKVAVGHAEAHAKVSKIMGEKGYTRKAKAHDEMSKAFSAVAAGDDDAVRTHARAARAANPIMIHGEPALQAAHDTLNQHAATLINRVGNIDPKSLDYDSHIAASKRVLSNSSYQKADMKRKFQAVASAHSSLANAHNVLESGDVEGAQKYLDDAQAFAKKGAGMDANRVVQDRKDQSWDDKEAVRTGIDEVKRRIAGKGNTPEPEPTPPVTPGKAGKEPTNHAFLAASAWSDGKALKSEADGGDWSKAASAADHMTLGDTHDHLDMAYKALAKGDKAGATEHLKNAQHGLNKLGKASAGNGKEFSTSHKLAIKANDDLQDKLGILPKKA